MIKLACLLVAALCAFPQGEEEPSSIEEELAQLIEKTNALETFHVVYSMENTTSGESVPVFAEFVYRAPDLGRMRSFTPDGMLDIWILGNRTYGRFPGSTDWGMAEFPTPLPAHDLLDKVFPNEESGLEPGVALDLILAVDPDTNMAGFNWRFGREFCDRCGRRYVLGWLVHMKQRAEEMTDEGAHIVWSEDRYKCFVSKETGFPESIEIVGKTGDLGTLRLQECHLNEPLDPSLVALPAGAHEAAVNEDLSRNLAQGVDPQRARQGGFARVRRQLYSEKRSWDESTRDDWRAFLDMLHRGVLDQLVPKQIQEYQTRSDQYAEWARSQLSNDDSGGSRAELEEKVDGYYAQIEENLDSMETQYVEYLGAIEPVDVTVKQLLEVEIEVLGELFEEILR